MSDRFKFRVYIPDENRYMDNRVDNPIINGDGEAMWSCLNSFGHWEHYSMEKVVIEQCTGLTDKNGKPIFEGDVLNCIDTKLIVCFNPEIAAFVFVRDFDIELCRSLDTAIKMRNAMPARNAGYINRYEIIGNIHDEEVEK